MINQYRVFQIKEVHHQHWAKSYAQQVEDGFLIHHQNYQSAYKGKPAPSDTPMTARKRLEEKRPNTFIGRSFGVGDKGTTLGIDVVVSNLVNTMYCRDAGKKLRTANQVKWRKGITTASAAPFGKHFKC